MTWFAIWKTSDGELVSVGTVVSSPLPSGLSSTELGESPPSGVWNSSTHVFDAAAVLKPVLRLRDFQQRFTQAEREALWDVQQNGTATQKKKLGAFRQYLTDAGEADLNDAYIVSSVNLMETAGVIAAGRAAQVLA